MVLLYCEVLPILFEFLNGDSNFYDIGHEFTDKTFFYLLFFNSSSSGLSASVVNFWQEPQSTTYTGSKLKEDYLDFVPWLDNKII